MAVLLTWLASGVLGNGTYDFLKSVALPWLITETPVPQGLTLGFYVFLVSSIVLGGVAMNSSVLLAERSSRLRAREIDLAQREAELKEVTATSVALRERVAELTAQMNRAGEAFPEHMAGKLERALAAHGKLLVEIDEFRKRPQSQPSGHEQCVTWWSNFVEGLIRDLTRVFEDLGVNHGSVLLPSTGGEYLRISVGSWVIPTSLRGRKFYCGPDEKLSRLRGVAGTVFALRQPVYEPDVANSDHHLPLDEHVLPTYESVLAVPIGNDIPPMGVLSIEARRDAFEPKLDALILQVLGDVVATALREVLGRGVRIEELLGPNASEPAA